jgi:hypothetical protein
MKDENTPAPGPYADELAAAERLLAEVFKLFAPPKEHQSNGEI